MLARFVLGTVTAGAMIAPALAGQMMNADEARRFVAGKVFAFTCFDGTRGAGRILDDMGAAGAVQFSGSGPMRHMRLARQYAPGPRPGRLRVDQGHSVRAVLQSRQEGRTQLPRLGVGHGLRLLRFPSSGRGADADGARGGPAAFAASAGADRGGAASRTEVSARVETPRVESAKIEPVKSEPPNRNRRNRKARRNCAARPTDGVCGLLQLAAAPPGGAACRRNRMRWYSQPIATSTSPRHMNDSAR